MKSKEVRLHELEKTARELASMVGDAIERRHPAKTGGGVGFCLLVFTFDKGWSTFITNAQPEDMIRELRELADEREKELKKNKPGYEKLTGK